MGDPPALGSNVWAVTAIGKVRTIMWYINKRKNFGRRQREPNISG